jgi:putative NIF3 family GTP cyclohydrolase 1 type 2
MSEKNVSKMLFSNQERVELSKIDDVRELLEDAKSKFKKANGIKKELRSLISDAMIRADMNVKGQATNLIKQAEDLGADKIVSELKSMISEGQKLTNEYKTLYNALK